MKPKMPMRIKFMIARRALWYWWRGSPWRIAYAVAQLDIGDALLNALIAHLSKKVTNP